MVAMAAISITDDLSHSQATARQALSAERGERGNLEIPDKIEGQLVTGFQHAQPSLVSVGNRVKIGDPKGKGFPIVG